MKLPDLMMVLGIVVLWGLWAFAGKVASQRIGMQVPFWSFLASVALMMGYLISSGKLSPLQFDRTGIAFAIASGVTLTAGSIMYYILLERKPVGALVVTTSLYPFIALLLSAMFLSEKITPMKGVGIVFAIIAIILLS